ncbi:MAG: hypothetical protein K9H26_00620 [Prolixibacteraceae bacterium]|nr:hypothetical protein [Prolixibacteraceae bacterium]
MKSFYLVVGILFLSLEPQSLFSQESEFDLKGYKTTDYARSSLELQFDLTEQAGITTSTTDNLIVVETEATNKQSNFGLDLDLNYSNIVLSKNKVLEYGVNLILNNSFLKKASQQSDSVIRFSTLQQFSVNNQLYAFYNSDFYYTTKNRNFFKYGGEISIQPAYSFNKKETEVLSEKVNETGPDIETRISFDIGHGYGRIENVEDAVEAMYILNDLSNDGLLIRPYTDHDVTGMADKITLIRKERYFDFRLTIICRSG